MDPISFGFNTGNFATEGGPLPAVGPTRERDALAVPVSKRSPIDERHKGLGTDLGSQLTRSALGSTAYAPLDPFERTRQHRWEPGSKVLRSHKITRLRNAADVALDARSSVVGSAADEPQRMFRELLLSDHSWATKP